jgi:3-dehydroquinate synthetase
VPILIPDGDRFNNLAPAGRTKDAQLSANADRDALVAHVTQMGPLPAVSDLSAAEVVEATRRDKKVIAGRLHFVLPTAIGSTTTVADVTPEELTQALLAIGLKG